MLYPNLENQEKERKLRKIIVDNQSEIANSLFQQYIADYKRVSTDKQDLQLQIDSNQRILKMEDRERIIDYTDDGVSAYRIPLEERTELKKMIKDIEEGRIYKVVVYARDRLARNVYEYMHIVKIFLKHKVEVIFSNGATPFSYDLKIETFFGLFAQLEGQNINRRVKEILSRYPVLSIIPNTLFIVLPGYRKNKHVIKN